MRAGRALAFAGAALLLAVTAGPASAADLTVSPSNLAFGNVFVGTQSSGQTVTVTNTGIGSEEIQGVLESGTNTSEFADTGGTCMPFPKALPASQSCTIEFQFSPTSRGAKSALVTLMDSDGDADTVSLSGTGVAPTIDFSVTDLAFGDQALGTTSSAQTVTISNNGNAILTIASIGKVGDNPGDFVIENNTCASFPNLSNGQSCSLQVRFAPAAAGPRDAAIRVTSNAPPDGEDDLPIAGTGVTVPELSFDPALLSFASQVTGTSSAIQTLTLTSTGSGDIELESIDVAGVNAGDFSIENNTCLPLPRTVGPGEDCTLDVRFTPTATGTRSAGVHVVSSLAEHDAPLEGTGAAPPDPPPPDPGIGTQESEPEPAPLLTTTTPPAVATTPVAPGCRVPKLVGRTLAAARRALRRAHCAVGKVTRRLSKKRPGRVLRQGRRAGARLRNGARVALLVSRR